MRQDLIAFRAPNNFPNADENANTLDRDANTLDGDANISDESQNTPDESANIGDGDQNAMEITLPEWPARGGGCVVGSDKSLPIIPHK